MWMCTWISSLGHGLFLLDCEPLRWCSAANGDWAWAWTGSGLRAAWLLTPFPLPELVTPPDPWLPLKWLRCTDKSWGKSPRSNLNGIDCSRVEAWPSMEDEDDEGFLLLFPKTNISFLVWPFLIVHHVAPYVARHVLYYFRWIEGLNSMFWTW